MLTQCERIPLPENFFLGASTASYQIEGAWNEDGKGESIWDRLQHDNPHYVIDGHNGDITCDSYHKFEEDVQLLKKMNLNMYRFSVSWPRLLPKGDLTEINEQGIAYYNKLIDRLIEEGITPLVTIYHWDLPLRLQEDFGGWVNPLIVNYFEDYAWLLFSRFGDRVKWWVTVNEPMISCYGYTMEEPFFMAPGKTLDGIGNYHCGHNHLRAHARAYHLYNKQFRAEQNGNVGIAINIFWPEPKSNTPDDIAAANDRMTWEFDWLAHPIFSENGDYPEIMKKRVLENSLKEGLRHSRLPEFTQQEIAMIQGSADFLGINTYSTNLITRGESGPSPSWTRDQNIIIERDASWPTSGAFWINNVPWGVYKLLKYIHNKYPDYQLIMTENGYPDEGGLNDVTRAKYIQEHMKYSLKAIYEAKVPLIGYLYWSLLDNLEWSFGFSIRFGLIDVDVNDPERKRTMKHSAYVYADIAKQWSVPVDAQYCSQKCIDEL